MIELAFKVHGQIVGYWKIFIPSAVALLGWIFARKAPWRWNQRISIAIAFAGFVAMNLYGLVRSYGLLDTLVAELRATKVISDLSEPAVQAVLSRFDMGWSWKLGIVFHIIVDIGVLYFILIWAGKKDDFYQQLSGQGQ